MRSLLALILLVHSGLLSAQKPEVSTPMPGVGNTTRAAVLATARKDERYVRTLALADQAATLPQKDGFLRSVEARVGINGSALGDTIYGYIRNEDAYGLILSTNSLRELRRQRELMQAQIAGYRSEADVYLEAALYTRYEAMARCYYAEKELTALQSTARLLTERQRILRTTAQAAQSVRPKDVIDTERDRLRVAEQIASAERQIRTLRSALGTMLGMTSEVQIDSVGFIALRQISATVSSQAASTAARPEVAMRQARLAIEDAKVNYANSQNRQIFQSLRLGYDRPLYLTRPNRFNTTNNISARVGLAIPMPSNNRFRKSQALLDRLEAERAAAATFSTNTDDLVRLRSEITELGRFHATCTEQQQQSLLPVYLNNEALKAQLSPLEINELQSTQQAMQSRMLETEREVTLLWLEYVKAAGWLLQDRDWLKGE